MIRYQIDSRGLEKAIEKQGYKNLTEFVNKTSFNRMTLSHYLKGAGPLSATYYELCDFLEEDPLKLLVPALSESPSHSQEILPLVKKITQDDPSLAVSLFGSRASGKAKKYSDWDLGITQGHHALSTKNYLSLKNKIDDLAEDLPRFIDLINLDQAPLWFFKKITYEPIFLGGNEKNWQYFLGVLDGIRRQGQIKTLS